MAADAQQPGALLRLRGSPESTTARSESCYQQQQSRDIKQMFALKREQRRAPAVLEAVRQRCSHIAATKADQVFNVICSQGRLRDVHLPCGCLTCTATDARTLLLTQSLTCIAAVSCRIMPVKQFTYKRGGGGRSDMGGGWHNAHETSATAGLAAYPSARREAERSAAMRGLIATLCCASIAVTRPSQVPGSDCQLIHLFIVSCTSEAE